MIIKANVRWEMGGHPVRTIKTRLSAGAIAAAVALAMVGAGSADAGPTPEEYMKHVGGDAKLLPSGSLSLDGYKMRCGQRQLCRLHRMRLGVWRWL